MPSPLSAARHVAVVGGGISGLAAAYALHEAEPALRVSLLEAAGVVGGKLRVIDVAGVAVDGGAEAMLARRPEAVALARAVGLGSDIVHPATSASGVWTRGWIRPLPPTLFGVPADLRALAGSGVLSRRGLARVPLERLLPARPVAGDVAVGRLVAARLGREVRDRLVEPLLGGVYAGRADELSVRAAVPPLAAALDRGGPLVRAATAAVRAAPGGPVFAGITGGVGRLPAAVAAAAGAEVRTGVTVRELRRLPQGRWRLVTGPVPAAETMDVDAVVLALPATPAARLLCDVAPAAAAELGRIGYASVAIVTLALPRAAFPAPPQGSGFLVPVVEGRRIKACTYSSVKWGWLGSAAGDAVILRCSLGRHGETRDLQRDDTELVRLAAGDLTDAVGVRGPLLDSQVSRWGGSLPQYAVGHLDRVARIRSAVARLPGLAVCGAAYDGVGIAACISSGQQAATRVLADLRTRATMQA